MSSICVLHAISIHSFLSQTFLKFHEMGVMNQTFSALSVRALSLYSTAQDKKFTLILFIKKVFILNYMKRINNIIIHTIKFSDILTKCGRYLCN